MENRQDFEEQEQAQLWSLLSDSQKWLLCLMVLYPSSHWSGLHPYVKKGEDQLRQLQEDWEGLLAYGVCTQRSEDSPMCAIAPLWPSLCDEGFRLWLVSEIARVQFRKKKDLWLPGARDLVGEQLSQLSPKQRDLLQQALMRQIDKVSLSGLEYLHLSFYRNIWKALLIQWEMHEEMVDLCEVFLTRLPGEMDKEELWECAYHATNISSPRYREIAMKRYKDYLEYGESHAAYHNLSLLHKREHRYQEALKMIGHALRLEPLDVDSLNLKSPIENAIRDVEHRRIQKEFELQQQQE